MDLPEESRPSSASTGGLQSRNAIASLTGIPWATNI